MSFPVVLLPAISARGRGETKWRTAMKLLAQKVHRFLVSEDGPTAVEYAVMLALIIVVCLASIQAIGSSAKTTFDTVNTSLS